jgi:hypothetical protein
MIKSEKINQQKTESPKKETNLKNETEQNSALKNKYPPSSDNNFDKSDKSSFFKRNKKQIKLTAMLLALLTIVIFTYFTTLNVRFSIKEDLRIEIAERHLNFDINQETPADIDIPITIRTSRLCKASCIQTFTNINSGETEFSDEFTFRRTHNIEFERTIYPYIIGEGQDIYLYSINCTNIVTSNCPSGDDAVEKDIIITLTRTLTQSETNLKSSEEKSLGEAYAILNEGSKQIELANITISRLKFAKKNDLENDLENLRKQKSEFYDSLLVSTEAWSSYNFSLTNRIIQSENLVSRANNFQSNSSKIYTATNDRAYTHNSAVYLSYLYSEELSSSTNALTRSDQFLYAHFNELNSDLKEAKSLLLFSSRKLNHKDFETYSEIFDILNGINQSIDSFKKNYVTYMQNNSLFTKASLDLLITKENLCIISNSNGTNCENNLSNSLINYSNLNYDNLSLQTAEFCKSYENTSIIKNNILRSAALNRVNLSTDFLNEIDNESARYTLFLLMKHRDELITRNDSAATYAVSVLNEYISSLERKSGLSENNVTRADINSSLIIYFTPINFTFEGFDNCDLSLTAPLQINLSYENISEINSSAEVIANNYHLPELLPRACFDSNCQPYIHNPSKNYPLILVHGHGFYSKNAPVTPSQIYNELQKQLLCDKLYVPAGILREGEPVLAGSLSYVDIPFVYKATYYPEEILNNESIDLFAVRLNQIIHDAKKETGKDKVIIIAHSMGGLVTRTYLKKYGTDDVESVIIGGTPNYGVTSETVTLCKLFGRDLECDEMYEKSDFISNLKDEPHYNIPIYTLRGEGCSTFGADGDGIVQSKRVPLPYAENFAFNGTCSMTGQFHINLLNPYQNPKIYTKLKEILIENRK